MHNEVWRFPRVLAAIGMGRSWVYDQVKAGQFPAPIKLGARAIGWRREDIEAWIASREADKAA